MKKIRIALFSLFLLISINLTLHYISFSGIIKGYNDNLDGKSYTLNNSYVNLTSSPIMIDDWNPNYNWSKTASENAWCTGSGTSNDPYIIEDVLIDGLDGGYCVSIYNSDVHFILRKCMLYNVGSTIDYAPITLWNTNNGRIIDNTLEDGQTGIYLEDSANNNISNNILNDLVYGIHLENSRYNTISNNDLETHTMAVFLKYSNNNNISLNNLIDINGDGLHLSSSDHNILSKNTIIYPNWGISSSGIDLTSCYNITIVGNHIEEGATGIFFRYTNTEIIIKDNIIIDNLRGINIAYDTSTNNTIYNNCFIGNDWYENARDIAPFNHWDNGSSGNYWDDYSGVDNDGDGIGNSPYSIAGSAGSVDNFPLMRCPFPVPRPASFNWLPVILGVVISSVAIGITLAIYFLKFRKPK